MLPKRKVKMSKVKEIFDRIFTSSRKEKIKGTFSFLSKEKLKESFSKENVKRVSLDMILLLIACSFGCFSIVSVMIPNGMTIGGMTGVARIIQNFTGMEFSILLYGLSFIVLILVIIFLGFKEAKKILLLTIMYPAIMMVFEKLDFRLLETKDILLAAVFCGVFSGLCIGIVFWRGYAFSGSDAIAKILRRKLFPQISQSKIMLVIDAVIIISSAFIFGRNIALYALITQVVIAKTIDAVMYGFESKIVQLEIITRKREEISRYILDNVNRGASSHPITGEYSGEEYTKIRVLCSPRESIVVRRHIAKIDPRAFVTVIQVDNAWGAGRGFKDIDNE